MNQRQQEQNDEGEKKLFFTTTDLLNKMNSVLSRLEGPDDVVSPRFELQKRLENGSTVPADAKDMAIADMESKFKQAATEVKDLTKEQKLEWANIQRQEGNALYAKGNYAEAIDVYLTCLVVKSDDDRFMEKVYLPVMSNLAQCTLQLGNYKKTLAFCTMALEEKGLPNLPEGIAKVYFRRGKAYRLSGEYQLARRDLETSRDILLGTQDDVESELKAVAKELELVERGHNEWKRNKARQEQAMKRVFDAAAELSRDTADSSNTSHSGRIPRPEDTHTKSTLYGEQKRTHSKLRARRHTVDNAEEEPAEVIRTYWQYYITMVGSVAERLLIFLGDDDTIRTRRARIAKEN
jgi:tetratricopeptide (TPR) repeat protein